MDSLFGENTDDPISTVQDSDEVRVSPPPTQARELLPHVSFKPPTSKCKIKKSNDIQQQMLDLEKAKLQWLEKEDCSDDDDLNFFKCLIPYMKPFPPFTKLCVRSQLQNIIIISELSGLNSQQQQSTNYVSHPSSSPASSSTSHQSQSCEKKISRITTMPFC